MSVTVRDVIEAEQELALFRVWFARKETPQYELRRALDSDGIYRSYPKRKRVTITRVERVVKSSEGRALDALGGFLQAMARSRRKRRAA